MKQYINPYRAFNGTVLPDFLMAMDLPLPAKVLYGRLMRYAGKNGRAYPSVAALAAFLQCKARQIQNMAKLLEDAKLIERSVNTGPGGANNYLFLYHENMHDDPDFKPKKAIIKGHPINSNQAATNSNRGAEKCTPGVQNNAWGGAEKCRGGVQDNAPLLRVSDSAPGREGRESMKRVTEESAMGRFGEEEQKDTDRENETESLDMETPIATWIQQRVPGFNLNTAAKRQALQGGDSPRLRQEILNLLAKGPAKTKDILALAPPQRTFGSAAPTKSFSRTQFGSAPQRPRYEQNRPPKRNYADETARDIERILATLN